MGILKFILGLFGIGKKSDAPVIDHKPAYRTEEQEKAKFYFDEKNTKGCLKGCLGSVKGCFKKKKTVKVKTKGGGCFPKKPEFISDADYDAIVQKMVNSLNPEARGLDMLVLDKSQVEKTVCIANYKYKVPESYKEYDPDDIWSWKIGEDGKFRSSVFEVNYLFFTRDEVALYKLTLSSDWAKHDEQTYEYHYKDISAFSTNIYQKDVFVERNGELVKEYQTVQNEFTITVPGDSFSASLGNKMTPEEKDAILAMKSLLREKKA